MSKESQDKLATMVYATSTLLQELLDATQGVTKFKNRCRFNINRLQEDLDKINSVEITSDEVSMTVNKMVEAMEESLSSSLGIDK